MCKIGKVTHLGWCLKGTKGETYFFFLLFSRGAPYLLENNPFRLFAGTLLTYTDAFSHAYTLQPAGYEDVCRLSATKKTSVQSSDLRLPLQQGTCQLGWQSGAALLM